MVYTNRTTLCYTANSTQNYEIKQGEQGRVEILLAK